MAVLSQVPINQRLVKAFSPQRSNVADLKAEINPVPHTVAVWHVRFRVRRLVVLPSYTLVLFIKAPFTTDFHRTFVVFAVSAKATNVLLGFIEAPFTADFHRTFVVFAVNLSTANVLLGFIE